MSDKQYHEQYINAVEYSQHLEQLLSVELKNTSALLSELAAAERERDELRERLSLVRKQRDAELNKNTQLEAELARRDAAAGEPVAYQIHSDLEGWRECTPERYTEVSSRPLVEGKHSGGWLVRKLHTAAQPAASAPDGWKLVPLKAFPSQWAAGQKAFDAAGINKIDPVYHAMVEAAPAPGGDDA